MNNGRTTPWNPIPQGQYAANPELANQLTDNPVFASLMAEVHDLRERQRARWQYVYGFADQIAGQQTLPFTLTIEAGTDFKCEWLTASVFSYDAVNPTTFPIPNALGSTAWAGRGLSVSIHDEGSSRDLTSGFIPIELIATPGYGLNFQYPYPFKYHFRKNSQIRFDVRNRDGALRTHEFSFALLGYKYLVAS